MTAFFFKRSDPLHTGQCGFIAARAVCASSSQRYLLSSNRSFQQLDSGRRRSSASNGEAPVSGRLENPELTGVCSLTRTCSVDEAQEPAGTKGRCEPNRNSGLVAKAWQLGREHVPNATSRSSL